MESEKKKHPHHGNRKRMISHFISSSKASLTDIQFVEMLLFYCIPRSDTNPTAHALLNRFGNIRSILAADENDIASVEGMGIVSASKLKKISRLAYRYEKAVARNSNDNSLSANIISKIQEHLYSTAKIPRFICMCFSSEGELLFCRMFEDNLKSTLANISDSFTPSDDMLMLLCVSEKQSYITFDEKISIDDLDAKALREFKIDVLAHVFNDKRIIYKII